MKVTIYIIYERLLRNYLNSYAIVICISFIRILPSECSVPRPSPSAQLIAVVLRKTFTESYFREMHYLRKQYEVPRQFSVGVIDIQLICVSMSRYQNAA
jgi:hypothetical protein